VTTAKDEEIFKLRSALSLARLHYEQGLYDRAEPVYRRALLFFEHGEELRQCLQCLAVLYSVRNHYSDALEMYVRLLALNENEYGKTDRRTIAVMREMASIYVQMGQQPKADKIHQKATMRERERERPLIEYLEADEDGHEQVGTMPAEAADTKAQKAVEKYRDELRPLVSGLIVDFTDRRTLFLAKLIIAGILLSVVLLVAIVLPRDPSPIAVYKSIPHHYETADGRASFTLLNDNQCSFTVKSTYPTTPPSDETQNPTLITMPYSQYLSDWRDVVGILYSSIYDKLYCVSRSDEAVLDEEQRTYYGLPSPEKTVIDEMRVIKNQVGSFYIIKRKYPKVLSARIILPYTNPCTNKQEMPNSQVLTIGNQTWNTAQSLKERAKLYNLLLNGGTWPNEPTLSPGAINTCTLVMVSEAGEFYDFLIRGCDRNGKTLLTSVPGKAYIMSLQGAKDFEAPTPLVPFAGQLLVRPRHVWLLRPNLPAIETDFRQHGLSYIGGFVALCIILLWVKKRFFSAEGKTTKYIVYASICLLLSLVYEISQRCP